MLRNILLKIIHSNSKKRNCKYAVTIGLNQTSVRKFSDKVQNSNYDLNDDFIESYNSTTQINKIPTKKLLINKFQELLDCTQETATMVVNEEKKLKTKSLKHITQIINYLLNEKISSESILNNPSLLVSNLDVIKTKVGLIKKMDPKDINDFVPLMKINPLKLSKIAKESSREVGFTTYRNRVYYFSEKLKVNPEIVSRYFSTHSFMFEITHENFIEKLGVFISYNVASINILRDLWAFRYTPESIKKRLERAKIAQKDKIMPWMVRCPEPVLAKSLQLTSECKALLGENDSVLEYLSKRLSYDLATTKFIVSKHPSVLKVRVTKIKDILDFLLDEGGYTTHQIAMVPRILCHSLETTKMRLKELKEHDCIPNSLVVVCRSRREYQKFLDNWIAVGNRLRQRLKS